MAIELNKYQLNAVDHLKNGSILVGDVGSGKSRTALAYYYISVCRGSMKINGSGSFRKMTDARDLYIITTAKKRDSLEWQKELSDFCLVEGINDEMDGVRVVIDSWNNIKKYSNVYSSFFIFDEQRVVGWGTWSKTFVKISRKNKWILLSATPGDKWTDYIPVFIANGFYKNKTDFSRRHCIFNSYAKYPKIEGYKDEGVLLKHRYEISVPLPVDRHTTPYHLNYKCNFDKDMYKSVRKNYWDPFENEMIEETAKLFYVLRRVVNDDASRYEAVRRIAESHRRIIIFYNFTYELRGLRKLGEEIGFEVGEWNGELHTQVPDSKQWLYLVQYSAGCEGWNCITTNCMIFFSQSYSYRMMKQAEGRINRMNTPYTELFYYHLISSSSIDLAIKMALLKKHDFNEAKYLKNHKF